MTAATDTLVLQSYRRERVPGWLRRCLGSVEAWADDAGHAYEFVDDRLFDRLPGWFRERCGDRLLPQTDLARLLLIREKLAAGIRRVAWLDADVFVFAPEHLRLDGEDSFAFCREAWLDRGGDGCVLATPKVNNAAMVFAAGNPALDFLIHACLTIAAHRPRGGIGTFDFGPVLLTQLSNVLPVPVIGCVGMIGPLLAEELGRGGGPLCATYAMACGQPLGAANLCGSLVGDPRTPGFDEAALSRAMDALERTRGEIINGHLGSPAKTR